MVALDRLVSASDIAVILSVSPAAVSNWQSRDIDFPAPIRAWGQFKVWDVDEVIKWHVERKDRSDANKCWCCGR